MTNIDLRTRKLIANAKISTVSEIIKSKKTLIKMWNKREQSLLPQQTAVPSVYEISPP